ncbi:MAG: hypothetical protein V1820_06720 [archaeon]
MAYNNRKTIGIISAFFLAFAFLAVMPGFAASGISVSPSTGNYDIRRGGGNVDFLVTNFGDSSEVFQFSIYGDAAAYSSVSPASQTIGPMETKKFTVTFTPANAQYNKKYLLSTLASSTSTRATGQLGIYFKNEAGASNYVVSKIPTLSVSGTAGQPSLATKLFTIFAAALLIGLGYYLIKTKGPWKE